MDKKGQILFWWIVRGCIPAIILLMVISHLPPTMAAHPPASPAASTSAYLPVIRDNYPISPSIFGAHLDSISAAGGLDQMVAARSYWTRTGLPWALVESTENARDWYQMAGLEVELQNAAKYGMQTILIVGNTPDWALKEGYTCGAVALDKFPALASFMSDLVERYSAPPFNVKYWELWNEPDVYDELGCWGDPDDTNFYGGSYYGDMLKVVYPAIKAADPGAQVFVGGLLMNCDPLNPPEVPPGSGNYLDCSPSNFLAGILATGAGDAFDGVSFHAYDYYLDGVGHYGNSNWNSTWQDGPVLEKKAGFLKQVLTDYNVAGKSLINSEIALICEMCSDNANFEATKVSYLAESYSAALAEGLIGNIWFSVLGWRNSGLLNADLAPKPAYTAFEVARSALGKTTFQQEINPAGGVTIYEFTGVHTRLWVAWSVDGSSHSLSLNDLPDAVFDALGTALPLSTTISLAPHQPVYIQWTE